MSLALLIPAVLLPLAVEQPAEAEDNTFIDIKKITRNSNVSDLFVFKDRLIATYRYYANHPMLITSYSKTGTLNWERSESGPLAITETKFARVHNDLLFIHSTATGEILKTVKFLYTIDKIYMNESFIVMSNRSSQYVYDTNGNYVMKVGTDVLRGASLTGNTLILQDSKSVYSFNLATRQKLWTVLFEASSFSFQTLLKPINNVLYAQGSEPRDSTGTSLPKEVLIAINATTGAVLYKKDFGNYEETRARVKDFGLLVNHDYEDVHRIYHPDGKVKLELNMESEAIKQLKQKHFVYGTYYNGAENYLASKQGIYYFKMYDAVHDEFLFSSIKSLDHAGNVKFEKVIENEYIFGIATTASDKLFVAHGNAFGMSNGTNLLDVYDADGTLLDSIETEYIPHLKADGSTLYGYGGNELYIFKEKAVTTVSNKVSHHSTRIIGTAGAGSKITVHAGTTALGSATADTAGNYAVPIATQKIGTVLTVVSTDSAGNRSAPVVVTVADGNYPDLRVTHWALKEIMYLGDDRIIGGYPTGEFQPERNATRAEAAKMLAIALNLPVPVATSAYKDVHSSHWAKDYIAAASKAGFFNGNPDGTFAPDKVLKRAEMAKIISVAYAFKASDTSYFTDVKSGYWAKGYISGLYENGITTGYPDKTFHPEEATTRAEFSVFLARALNKEFR